MQLTMRGTAIVVTILSSIGFTVILLISEMAQYHFQQIGHLYRPSHAYETCIMTRIKNCHHLLPQWIEYHFQSGVEHFFISNDCSEDPRTLFWLEQYEARGIVTVFYNQSYNDCQHQPNEALHFRFLLGQSKSSCRWIGAIDVDEYIFPSNKHTSISFIKEVLIKHKFPLVRMPWVYMYHMGYEEFPNDLVINAYRDGHPLGTAHIKSFAMTEYILDWTSSHYPRFYRDVYTIPGSGIDISDYAHDYLTKHGEIKTVKMNDSDCNYPVSPFYIRHYYIRAWADYLETKVNRKYASDGSVNRYAADDTVARERWSSNKGNVETKCSLPGEEHKELISPIIFNSVLKNFEILITQNQSAPIDLYYRWLSGDY